MTEEQMKQEIRQEMFRAWFMMARAWESGEEAQKLHHRVARYSQAVRDCRQIIYEGEQWNEWQDEANRWFAHWRKGRDDR